MAELKKLADLRGEKGDIGAINPAIYIGPDEPDPENYVIWIDTRGLEAD